MLDGMLGAATYDEVQTWSARFGWRRCQHSLTHLTLQVHILRLGTAPCLAMSPHRSLGGLQLRRQPAQPLPEAGGIVSSRARAGGGGLGRGEPVCEGVALGEQLQPRARRPSALRPEGSQLCLRG